MLRPCWRCPQGRNSEGEVAWSSTCPPSRLPLDKASGEPGAKRIWETGLWRTACLDLVQCREGPGRSEAGRPRVCSVNGGCQVAAVRIPQVDTGRDRL